MKDNLPKITDPAAQQQAQLDINMWQTLVDHMSALMEHMGPGMMGGMGGPGMMGHGDMGGMHGGMGGGMACCAGMKHDDAAHGDMKGGCCCCGGAGGMKCGGSPDKPGDAMDDKK
jgi:hypothetical protein